MLGDSNLSAETDSIINVEFEASSSFGIKEAEIYIDNKPVKLIKSDSQTLFNIELNLAEIDLSQGEHELSIVVRDGLGNQAGTFHHPTQILRFAKTEN